MARPTDSVASGSIPIRCVHGLTQSQCASCTSAKLRRKPASALIMAPSPSLACLDCGKVLKTVQGVTQHRITKHRPGRSKRRMTPSATAGLDPSTGRGFRYRGVSVQFNAAKKTYTELGRRHASPEAARRAIDRNLDSSGDEPSSSLRTVSGGLPTLGRRR